MKIKTKLTLGVGLLFLMIVLLVLVGTRYIHALAGDTQNILVSNYNTLDYARQMLIALDEDLTDPPVLTRFTTYLKKQQQNVTEIGEQELTDKLSTDFKKFGKHPETPASLTAIRKDLTDLMQLNMQAIQRKSAVAGKTADQAIYTIAITGAICFLIAFTLLINLPGNIANPIRQLSESIREIATENYSQRVHFESHSEFGDLASSFNTMAEKLEEYNNSNLAKLMMEKKRIETLINNMHDPVLGLDEDKRIIFMNDEALKIAGLRKEDTLGKPVQEIAILNDLIRSLVQDFFKPGTEAVRNQPIKIYADNKESFFTKQIIPIDIVETGETAARHIGDVILLQNITPFKELDVAKTHFIAIVSHELKTPISAIKMSLQLLENEKIGSLNGEQKSLIASIRDDANRLLTITGELLNMTQAETGNIQLSVMPADPKEILQYAITANKMAAEQKQIKFDIQTFPNLPQVLADSEKTAWVLTNLLSNAIRYSYDNSVIFLSILTENGKISFAVRDTGQGIAPQYKERIFDRYFRIPGSVKEGTGLGLAISKEFMEAQGGSIGVVSDFGAGSTFTIRLNAAS